MSDTTRKTGSSVEQLREQLRELAQSIGSDLSALDPAQSRELLGDFVSELSLAVADQNRRQERRQKQAAGIAAAKARGVQFGRPRSALPDDFEDICQAWRDGQISMRQAAAACGMSHASFRNAAEHLEQTAGRAV